MPISLWEIVGTKCQFWGKMMEKRLIRRLIRLLDVVYELILPGVQAAKIRNKRLTSGREFIPITPTLKP